MQAGWRDLIGELEGAIRNESSIVFAALESPALVDPGTGLAAAQTASDAALGIALIGRALLLSGGSEGSTGAGSAVRQPRVELIHAAISWATGGHAKDAVTSPAYVQISQSSSIANAKSRTFVQVVESAGADCLETARGYLIRFPDS